MYDLFLSYHWRDREAVESVAHALRQRGVHPFLDRWYLIPGRSWVEVLEKTLGECRALAVFLGPSGMGRWQQREKELGLDRQARDPAFSVIPVLLAGADPALGFLQVNTWVDLRNGETLDAIEVLARAARGEPPGHDMQTQLADARSGICPYRGLLPFREEDEAFFCGRQSFTERLVEAVEARSFVAVVGASGSGKSSVVRAGLMPALRRGGSRVPRRHVWDMVAMRPLEDPLHSLATCLLPLLEPEMGEVDRLREAAKLANSFRNREVKLRAAVERALEREPGTDRLLLAVDQWEELYTLCRDDGVRQSFVDQLLDASAGSKLSVVITLRGDFYGHALGDRPLSDRLQDGVVNIGPMTRDELRAAIVEPAKKVFLRFEEGLDARILNDVGEEPGNLPLLEFLLTELWDKRRGGELLHEAYDAIGGVRRAIADRAERTFDKLPAAQQEAARWALMQLVAPGEGALDSRRRAPLDSLGPAEREVIAKLAQERLVVTARDDAGREVVEIGHEALIREWGRLREWINEDREFLRVRLRLENEADLWKREGEPAELLLQHRRSLAEAEELLKARPRSVGPQVRAFVEASLAAERARQQAERERLEQQASIERERAEAAVFSAAVAQRLVRRTRNATVIVSGLLLVAIVAAGTAWYMAAEAKSQTKAAVHHAQVAQHNAQVAKDNAEIAERNAGIALKLATDLVTMVGEQIDTSEISSRVARELLKATEKTLANLKETKAAPEVTKGQIRLLMGLSDAFVHLGATDDALKHARTAKTLAELLIEPVDHQRFLFLAGFRVGDALADQGYLDSALTEYRAALKGAEFVLAHNPGGPISRGNVSFMHNKVGDILKAQGFQQAALDEYKKSLSIMRELAQERPSDATQQRNLAAALNRVGDGLREQGDYEGALGPYLEARDIYRGLVDGSPLNASLQMNLANSISNIGSVHRLLGDFEQAMEHYGESLRIRDEISKRDLSNATWQNLLSFVYINIGETLLGKEDSDGAEHAFRQALAIRQGLVVKDPKNALWQNNAAITLYKIGDALIEKRDADGALEQYREAVAIFEKLLQTTEGKFRPERALFSTRIKIGGALIVKGDPDGALGELKRALQIAEPIVRRDASDSAWQSNLSILQKKSGDALAAKKDLPGAIRQYLAAVALSEQVWKKDTTHAERQVALAGNRRALGDAYHAGGDRDKARRQYAEVVALLESVAEKHPSNRIWRRKLDDARQREQELALSQ